MIVIAQNKENKKTLINGVLISFIFTAIVESFLAILYAKNHSLGLFLFYSLFFVAGLGVEPSL